MGQAMKRKIQRRSLLLGLSPASRFITCAAYVIVVQCPQ